MKKKAIIIYSLIIVFVLAAAIELIRNKTDKPMDTPAPVQAVAEETPGAEEAAVSESPETTGSVYDGLPEHVVNVMKRSISPPDPDPLVGVGRGTEHGDVTEEAIINAGGLSDIIEGGDVVLIKPNLCTNARPDTPTTTDYRVTQKIVEMVKACGASRVIIAEGGFMGQNFSESALERNLYDQIENVEFVNINDCDREDCYALTTENSILGRELLVPKVYMDADKVITVAKLKTHFQPEAVVSLTAKNCYGAISSKLYGTSNKIGLHNMGFIETLVEINKIRRPDFAVIDGIMGGEGHGPVNNTPVESNIVFAGQNIIAVDTVALTFMGFAVDEVPHIRVAGENGLGITDLEQIQVEGADIGEIQMSFTR